MAAVFPMVAASVGGDPIDLPTDRFEELLALCDEAEARMRGDDVAPYVMARKQARMERILGL